MDQLMKLYLRPNFEMTYLSGCLTMSYPIYSPES